MTTMKSMANNKSTGSVSGIVSGIVSWTVNSKISNDVYLTAVKIMERPADSLVGDTSDEAVYWRSLALPSLNEFLNGLMTNEGSVDRTRKIISNDVFWALAQAVNHWPVLFEVRDAVCHEADRVVYGSVHNDLHNAVHNAMPGAVSWALSGAVSSAIVYGAHPALCKFLEEA